MADPHSWLSQKTNMVVTRANRLIEMRERENGYFDLKFVQAMPEAQQTRCLAYLDRSKAQLRQDLLALAMSDFKRDGFFVEFGATNGIDLNNSYLLETEFGWRGILAEPSLEWHDDLKRNRACTIVTDCVWRETGETISFTQAPRGENSGISDMIKASSKRRGSSYSVHTVSLTDMLDTAQAPDTIDFMSVDTEGSEFEILNAFDFDRYKIRVMAIEHNYAPQRQDIHALLTRHGYRRIHEEVSRFDDWYIADGVQA